MGPVPSAWYHGAGVCMDTAPTVTAQGELSPDRGLGLQGAEAGPQTPLSECGQLHTSCLLATQLSIERSLWKTKGRTQNHRKNHFLNGKDFGRCPVERFPHWTEELVFQGDARTRAQSCYRRSPERKDSVDSVMETLTRLLTDEAPEAQSGLWGV